MKIFRHEILIKAKQTGINGECPFPTTMNPVIIKRVEPENPVARFQDPIRFRFEYDCLQALEDGTVEMISQNRDIYHENGL